MWVCAGVGVGCGFNFLFNLPKIVVQNVLTSVFSDLYV